MSQQKLAIFDIDGTLFRWQLYHELVFKLKDKGLFDEKTTARLDEAFASWTTRKETFANYEHHVVRALLDNLASIPTAVFDETAKEIVESSGRKVYAYTRNLIQELKGEGYYLLAVSGSQQEIVAPFAAEYGFDDWIGALYERNGDAFTGKVERHVPGNKDTIIKEYVTSHGLSLQDSIAVGDSGGDITMLELVDHPIAFNPSDELLAIALQKGWKVVVERKNVAYALESNATGTTVLSATETLSSRQAT